METSSSAAHLRLCAVSSKTRHRISLSPWQQQRARYPMTSRGTSLTTTTARSRSPRQRQRLLPRRPACSTSEPGGPCFGKATRLNRSDRSPGR
eukprot:3044457-Lingulodinium_polyedra.AAC.1